MYWHGREFLLQAVHYNVMPLTHLQSQERRREAQRAKRKQSIPEEPEEQRSDVPNEPESDFPVAFATPPPPPAPTSEAVSGAESRSPGTPSPEPLRPRASVVPPTYQMVEASDVTANVKILHQVGPYSSGSVVPTSCFADIERLLALGAVKYTYERASTESGDPDIATAMSLARPVMTNRGIPHAPWVQSTLLDILGPAVPRTGVARQTPGYSSVPAEHGQVLHIAEPVARSQTGTGQVLTPAQMTESASEGFSRG